MKRVIEHLSVSENIESLKEFMEDFLIDPFSIEIEHVGQYISSSNVLMKLGFSRDLHWEERMLNLLHNKEVDRLYISVNFLGFTIHSSTSNKKNYKGIKDFIKSEDYFKLTQREWINLED